MTAHEFKVVAGPPGKYQFEGVLDIHEVEKLRDFLKSVSTVEGELEISLVGIEFIDVCALQALIAFKHSPGIGAKLRISEISREVEEILILCGLRSALLF